MTDSSNMLGYIPVDRGRALMRAFMRLLAGMLMAMMLRDAFSGLRIPPTGGTNLITEYATAVVLIPFAVLAVWVLFSGVRWLLVACWPAQIGVFLYPDALEFRLGSFGLCRMDAQRLYLQYPHEMEGDDIEETYESFEDPQVQEAKRLPVMRHPEAPNRRVDYIIEKFCSWDVPHLAKTFRPFVEAYRRRAIQSQGAST